ncbi:MAG TPA: flavodoxin domain-containing protein [Spirochaetia bacterium]|nr:flavodoxin domain-containing protein [Spirochaetia bacterium]
MKTLIAYASRYGTSETCARTLSRLIGGDSEVMNLRNGRLDDGSRPDIAAFEAVVVGGPIYAGRIMREVPAFCENNRSVLEARRVGLFICCLYEGERADAELTESFPPWIAAHAAGRYAFGGAVTLSRLGMLDRFLMRKVAQTDHDLNTVKEERISALAGDMIRSD